MLFKVGDIVKKKTNTQKYKVFELDPPDHYFVKIEPDTCPEATLRFNESELELVS